MLRRRMPDMAKNWMKLCFLFMAFLNKLVPVFFGGSAPMAVDDDGDGEGDAIDG